MKGAIKEEKVKRGKKSEKGSRVYGVVGSDRPP